MVGNTFVEEDPDILDEFDEDDFLEILTGKKTKKKPKEEEEEKEDFDDESKVIDREREDKKGKEYEDDDEAVLDAMKEEIMGEMAFASDPTFSERSRRKAYELHAMNPEFWGAVRLANLFRVNVSRMRLSLWTSKMEMQAEDEGIKLDDTIELLLGEHFGELDFPNDIAEIPDRIRYKNKRDTYFFIDDDLNRASLLKSLRRRDMVDYKESPRLPKKSIPPVQIISPPQPKGTKYSIYAGKHQNTFMMWDISPSKNLYDRLIVVRETDGSYRTGNWQDRRYVEDYRRFIKWPFKTPFIRPDDNEEDNVPIEAKLPDDFRVVFEDDFSDAKFSEDFKKFQMEADGEKDEEGADIDLSHFYREKKRFNDDSEIDFNFEEDDEHDEQGIDRRKDISPKRAEMIDLLKETFTRDERDIIRKLQTDGRKKERDYDIEHLEDPLGEEFYEDDDGEIDSIKYDLYKKRGQPLSVKPKVKEEVENYEDDYEEYDDYEEDNYPGIEDEDIDFIAMEPNTFTEKFGRIVRNDDFHIDEETLVNEADSMGPGLDIEGLYEDLEEFKEQGSKKNIKKNKKK